MQEDISPAKEIGAIVRSMETEVPTVLLPKLLLMDHEYKHNIYLVTRTLMSQVSLRMTKTMSVSEENLTETCTTTELMEYPATDEIDPT